jgi:hypothetical protein
MKHSDEELQIFMMEKLGLSPLNDSTTTTFWVARLVLEALQKWEAYREDNDTSD